MQEINTAVPCVYPDNIINTHNKFKKNRGSGRRRKERRRRRREGKMNGQEKRERRGMKEVRGEMPDVGDERKVAITNSAWVEVSRRMQEEGIMG